MSATCESCRYWEKKPQLDLQSGLCHRYPPNWFGDMKCAFPAVRSSDWCGEHDPGEQPDANV
jgi:hypothetical protein